MKYMIVALLATSLLAGCGEDPKPSAKPAEAPSPVASVPDPAALCTQAALLWFDGSYPGGSKTLKSGRVVQAAHSAHYNQKLKRCLIRAESNTAGAGKAPAVRSIWIFEGEARSKATLASFTQVGDKVSQCISGASKCDSLAAWESQAAALMKE